MNNVLIYSIFLFLWVSPSRQQVFTCDPATDCAAAAAVAGDRVPDPDNCEKYFICVQDTPGDLIPTASSFNCPAGQYFDQTSANCVNEAINGTCNNECKPGCVSTCPSYVELTFAADKFDCSTYFLCTQIGPVAVTCPPETLYFNGEGCVADASQCCTFCNIQCPVGTVTEIQDTCDCTSFYVCDTDGQIIAHGTCPSGEYFNESTFSCESGACTPVCTNCP